jgi:hypothetical protein
MIFKSGLIVKHIIKRKMAKRTDELPKKRMTGIDYRREWYLIQQSEKSLKVHVQQRLKELISKYPEMPDMPEILRREWFGEMSTYGMIGCIEKIEKWSASQEKITQGEIDYKPGYNID